MHCHSTIKFNLPVFIAATVHTLVSVQSAMEFDSHFPNLFLLCLSTLLILCDCVKLVLSVLPQLTEDEEACRIGCSLGNMLFIGKTGN